MSEKIKVQHGPKGIIGAQPECAPAFDPELKKARSAFKEKYGISAVPSGGRLIVYSFEQALDAQNAGYSFELKSLRPLDEELGERGL